MKHTNTLPWGFLVLSLLIVCVAIVPSACGAAYPSGFVAPMTLDSPAAPGAGGFASKYYSAVSAGIPSMTDPEGGFRSTSDIITDQELIDLVRSLNYPGIDKSVRVVTDQGDVEDSLDIKASSGNGVLITRSPHTSRIHISLLRESTARNSVDPMIWFNPPASSSVLPPDVLSVSHQYDIGRYFGPAIPDLIGGLNIHTGAYNLPVSGWATGGFSLPSGQAGSIMLRMDSIAPLPIGSSPLSPFASPVLPGGYAGSVFGSGPGSANTFQESQSVTGVVNGFSYQQTDSAWRT
jgi:hypothetical protein